MTTSAAIYFLLCFALDFQMLDLFSFLQLRGTGTRMPRLWLSDDLEQVRCVMHYRPPPKDKNREIAGADRES